MNHEDNGHDSAWLRRAFDRFEGPLVGYAARLSGNVERARDIVQDVFLRLCREGSERTEDHIAAWLYTVCRNRALDIRKERRMSGLSPETAGIVEAAVTDPAVAAERQDERAAGPAA